MLALKEGRTGLPIGGVFGAGKTRSAALLLAGLLVFDPSLKLMVVTKENVAAHFGDGTAVSSGPPERWEAPPVNPVHVLCQICPEHGPSASENPVNAQLLVIMPLLTTEPGEFFHLYQGLLPGYSGMKWVSSRILFELSGSKAAASNHLSSHLGHLLGNCYVIVKKY